MSRITSAVGIALQDGPGGMGLVPHKDIESVWGEITGVGPDQDQPWLYQWRQVIQDDDGEWIALIETAGVASAYGSHLKHAAEGYDNILLEPAVEMNQQVVQPGSIVRLFPSRKLINEQGDTHRFWVFSFHRLRAFQLSQTHIATGVIANEETQLEASIIRPRSMVSAPRATTLGCLWLDDLNESGVLYARHKAGNPAGDNYFRFGIALGTDDVLHAVPGFGSYGWAEYVPQATIIDYNEDGPVWRGEWQIVSIDSLEITQVVILETILPNELGEVSLQSRDQDPIPFQPSKIWVWNNLPVELTIGSIHNVHFDKFIYVWLPVTPIATPHGRTIYASGTIDVPPNNFTTIPMQDTIGKFGVEVVASGEGLQNVGPLALIGIVSWTVTAHRVIPGGGADIDSRLEAALFKGDAEVVGTASGMTSSRRIAGATGEGENATNSVSNTVIQILAPGETLTVRARVLNPADGSDRWQTTGNQCTLTFTSISSFLED